MHFLELSNGEAEHLGELITRAGELAEIDLGSLENPAVAAELLDKLTMLMNSNALADEDIDAVGAAFGEVLALHNDMTWSICLDDHGALMCVRPPGRTIAVYPIHMIAKRVDAGEQFSLNELVESTATAMKEHLADTDAYECEDQPQCIYGLNSIDITARSADDTALLVLFCTGRLWDDGRIPALLRAKLETYESYIHGPQFIEEFGPLAKCRPTIQILQYGSLEQPDAAIMQLIESEARRLAEDHISVTLEMDAGKDED